ncbi:endo-1,4-beta-xylanase [Belliella marina]|uniref:endo-1,4-beta-xylanase n=1 Tax=Belliella marina TaxID=1644146 RepID=A0ABW4VJC2_9BACT
MKNIKKYGIVASLAVLGFSCADIDPLEFDVEKPASIVEFDRINAFDDLKSYLPENSSFRIGSKIPLPDYGSMGLYYRVMNRNFNEITPSTEASHGAVVQNDGSLNLASLENFFDAVEVSGISVYWNNLITHSGQNSTYLNSIIAPLVIPGDEGTYLINFEDSEFGDNFPMHNGGSSVVVTDPVTQTGKVLNVLGPQTFPMFSITLPDGVTLGDVETLTFDFNGAGCCGLYGQGLRMGISDGPTVSTFTGYGSPASFGAPDGGWSRNAIILPFADLNLTASQKELNSFTLSVGSATGAANYFIDNLRLFWRQEGETIPKTGEEITEILTYEMDKWISGIAEVGNEGIKTWNVLSHPMSNDNPTELRSGEEMESIPDGTFFWQDHLGPQYGVLAFQMARQYGDSDDLYFINETGLVGNPAKLDGLMQYISYLESNGVQVDGIATEIRIDLSSSLAQVASLFQQLASTGMRIKISSLEVILDSTNPTPVMMNRQEDLYTELVESYFEHIPSNQQYGMVFGRAVDLQEDPLRQGIWYRYRTSENLLDRKPAYAGIAQGLINAFD